MTLGDLRELIVRRTGRFDLVGITGDEPDFFVDAGVDQYIHEARCNMVDKYPQMFPVIEEKRQIIQGQTEVPVTDLKAVDYVRLSQYPEGSVPSVEKSDKPVQRDRQYLVDTYGALLEDADQGQPKDWTPSEVAVATPYTELSSQSGDGFSVEWELLDGFFPEGATLEYAVGGWPVLTEISVGGQAILTFPLEIAERSTSRTLVIVGRIAAATGMSITVDAVIVDESGPLNIGPSVVLGSLGGVVSFSRILNFPIAWPPITRVGLLIVVDEGEHLSIPLTSFEVGTQVISPSTRGLIIMPPSDGNYWLHMYGRKEPVRLTESYESDWMTDQYGTVICREVCAALEVDHRNSEGVDLYEQDAAKKMKSQQRIIDHARMAEGPAEDWVMEG